MTYRFRVTDPMNDWFRAIEVDAENEDQALARAKSMMFARRGVGAGTCSLTLEQPGEERP
jgi:hypothetical protein